MLTNKRISFSLSAVITWIILSTSLLLLVTLLLIVKHEIDSTATESAEILFSEISTKAIAKVDNTLNSLSSLTDMAALNVKGELESSYEPLLSSDVSFMKSILDDYPQLMSAYTGRDDGTFHQVIALRGNNYLLRKYKSPDNTAYIDRIIVLAKDGSRIQTWCFLDADFKKINTITEPTSYDPRKRPWYKRAKAKGASVFTAPYIFSSSRLSGITSACPLFTNDGVFGVDVALAQLGDILSAQKVKTNGKIWLLDSYNRLIAYPGQIWKETVGNDLQFPAASKYSDALVREVARKLSNTKMPPPPSFLEVENETYLVKIGTMPATHGLNLDIVVAAPLKDFTIHMGRVTLRIFIAAACMFLLAIPLSLYLGKRAALPVKKLMQKANMSQHVEFSSYSPISSSIEEIRGLANAYERMKNTIETEALNLDRTQNNLEMLVKSGLALSEEKELATLVTLILETARRLTGADGGVIYLIENGNLGVELLSLGDKSLVLGGLSDNPAPRVIIKPEILPFLEQNSVLRPACEAFTTRELNSLVNVELSLFPTGLPEEPKDYPIRSLITVPIVTRRDEVLGVLQLFNPVVEAIDDSGENNANSLIDFVSSLAAQAAVTLDNRNLLDSQKELFNSLTQVVATSIDAKSPYTAGHCSRVPEICKMLAQAVHETEDGPYDKFRLETDDEWRQLWIASWLHDCGKVTTPESIIDKATKLETVYNRIHEIRMRFEVLRRDIEINIYQQLIKGDEEPEKLYAKRDAELKALENDFAFVASCNTSGESMPNKAKERLSKIAQRTWMRHFNDRLGISENELQSHGDIPEPELPTPEPLLADKKVHTEPRVKEYSDIKDAQNNPVLVPEYEYNKGEIYNLCIERGTLTEEERFKINEHTLSGLEMLNKIPFPDGLSKVPEIASAHHENLVGTGYPLKKNKEQLPVEARILAIADIFEALTASDRPYRKNKTVAEALKIMSIMRNDLHIDPDLFDIFLKQRIFEQYAHKYLSPEQMDVDDISPYLRTT